MSHPWVLDLDFRIYASSQKLYFDINHAFLFNEDVEIENLGALHVLLEPEL